MNIREKLDQLYGLRQERFNMNLDVEASIASHKVEIEKLTQYANERSEVIDDVIKDLESEIIAEARELKQSMVGTYLQVIYSKGRQIVDSDKLKKVFPQVYEKCTKETEPSVRIAEKK